MTRQDSPSDDPLRMSADSRRIIATKSFCQACGVPVVLLHHETFPEMRIEALSAERAAGHFVDRLKATLDSAPDASHREDVLRALADVQAFLNREGPPHLARDL